MKSRLTATHRSDTWQIHCSLLAGYCPCIKTHAKCEAFEYLRQDTSGSSQWEPPKRGTWLNLMSLSRFFFIAKNYIGSHSYRTVQTPWPQYSPSEVGVRGWIVHSKNVNSLRDAILINLKIHQYQLYYIWRERSQRNHGAQIRKCDLFSLTNFFFFFCKSSK